MNPNITPVPGAAIATATTHVQAAFDALKAFQVTLAEEERKSLNSRAMGRESIPYAITGQKLMATHPEVLSRSITDQKIADSALHLTAFQALDTFESEVMGLLQLVRDLGLVSGVTVMELTNSAYKDGQDDKARTPGVAPIVDEMARRWEKNRQPAAGGETPTPG